MIWTIESNERPVAACFAASKAVAEDLAESLRSDLMVLVDEEEVALWDAVSEITVREADTGESQKWESGVTKAIGEGVVASRDKAAEDGFMVFLIPYRDPTEDA